VRDLAEGRWVTGIQPDKTTPLRINHKVSQLESHRVRLHILNISHSQLKTFSPLIITIFAPHQTAKMASSNNEHDLLPDQTEGFKVGEKKTMDEYHQLGMWQPTLSLLFPIVLHRWGISFGICPCSFFKSIAKVM
jgi:hypothetical protein